MFSQELWREWSILLAFIWTNYCTIYLTIRAAWGLESMQTEQMLGHHHHQLWAWKSNHAVSQLLWPFSVGLKSVSIYPRTPVWLDYEFGWQWWIEKHNDLQRGQRNQIEEITVNLNNSHPISSSLQIYNDGDILDGKSLEQRGISKSHTHKVLRTNYMWISKLKGKGEGGLSLLSCWEFSSFV